MFVVAITIATWSLRVCWGGRAFRPTIPEETTMRWYDLFSLILRLSELAFLYAMPLCIKMFLFAALSFMQFISFFLSQAILLIQVALRVLSNWKHPQFRLATLCDYVWPFAIQCEVNLVPVSTWAWNQFMMKTKFLFTIWLVIMETHGQRVKFLGRKQRIRR